MVLIFPTNTKMFPQVRWKHWRNGQNIISFAQSFFNFFFLFLKEWCLQWIFHFQIPIGKFSSYLICFASDMVNLAEAKGVPQVWQHWGIYFSAWRKKVSAAKLWQSFTPKGPQWLLLPLLCSYSPASLYFIYNPQNTPPKTSQTIFHLSSHQVIINQLLLYLLLGIPCSSGSLHHHLCHISLLLLGLPSSKFPFITVQFSVL